MSSNNYFETEINNFESLTTYMLVNIAYSHCGSKKSCDTCFYNERCAKEQTPINIKKLAKELAYRCDLLIEANRNLENRIENEQMYNYREEYEKNMESLNKKFCLEDEK